MRIIMSRKRNNLRKQLLSYFEHHEIEAIIYLSLVLLSLIFKVHELSIIGTLLGGLLIFRIFRYQTESVKNNRTFIENVKSLLFNNPPLLKEGTHYESPINQLLIIYDSFNQEHHAISSLRHYLQSAVEKNFAEEEIEASTGVDESRSKDKLIHNMQKADAVIVFRTEYFEKNPWVYESIEKFAMRFGETPILFVDILPTSKKQIKKSLLPERYLFIKVDQHNFTTELVPFILLKRSIDRSKDWKALAIFNRTVALLFLITTAAFFTIGALFIKPYFNATNHIVRTDFTLQVYDPYSQICNAIKKEIIKANNIGSDIDFEVILWGSKHDSSYTIGRTRNERNKTVFYPATIGIISGAFRNRNKFVWWSMSSNNSPFFDKDFTAFGCYTNGEVLPNNDTSRKIIVYSDPSKKISTDTIVCILTKQGENLQNLLCYVNENGFGIGLNSANKNCVFFSSKATATILDSAVAVVFKNFSDPSRKVFLNPSSFSRSSSEMDDWDIYDSTGELIHKAK